MRCESALFLFPLTALIAHLGFGAVTGVISGRAQTRQVGGMSMTKFSKRLTLRTGASIGAVSIALLPAAAFAQSAPVTPAPPQNTPAVPDSAPTVARDTAAPVAPVTTTSADAQPSDTGQDIIVTGFRKSLQAALDLKRTAVGSVDAIVAEDIGKFPDQNLAELLQRIPGVAITRDGGEGREITVRGLGSQFTVTRVNGLPAQASSMLAGSGGSNNRDRSFDFNIFASELFRSLVVHKTAEPSIDEGSLGGVVDLNTGHPLGAKTGLSGLVSASASYNDLSKKAGPRLAGLLNWTSPTARSASTDRSPIRTPTRTSLATTPRAGHRRHSSRSPPAV